MPRTLSLDIFKLPLRLIGAVSSARKILKGSDLLIGFGGYLSASAYLAALTTGTPIVAHEANATVGWANKLAAVFTRNLAVAQPVKSGRFSRAEVTGLPLSADIKHAYEEASKDWSTARESAKVTMGWSLDHPSLVVLGGSQGSTFINSQIATALPYLTDKGIQVLHSVGANNEMPVNSKNYQAVPYITDMATAYLSADVVLARSGAVTCAEFATLGRLAVFVPLPIGNGEQARNADSLVASGRAIVVPQADFSAQWLIDNIESVVEKGRNLAEITPSLDLQAEERIVDLMERALRGSKA